MSEHQHFTYELESGYRSPFFWPTPGQAATAGFDRRSTSIAARTEVKVIGVIVDGCCPSGGLAASDPAAYASLTRTCDE